jgi:hypothetical protein
VDLLTISFWDEPVNKVSNSSRIMCWGNIVKAYMMTASRRIEKLADREIVV